MFDYYLSEVCSFPMTDKKGVDLEGKGDREGLGAAEGGEMVIKIYCLREESISYKYRQTNKQTNKKPQERKPNQTTTTKKAPSVSALYPVTSYSRAKPSGKTNNPHTT